MNIQITAIALAISICATSTVAQVAKEKPAPDANDKAAQVAQLDNFILSMFKQHVNNTLCMLGNVPVATVRGMVNEQLKTFGVKDSATEDQVRSALWTLFPCPFSPFRAEVIPATAKDIEGVWLFPYESQPYRYGQRSPLQPTDPAKAIACEIVGYYPKGEFRSGTIFDAKSSKSCTFRKAADLAPARKRPQLISWSMLSDGRLKISRTDGKEHIEEWDIYLVTKSFQALNMEIKAGDLISYLRREKDNDLNASTEFRHLQHLK